MKKILVTGAAGCLGRNLLAEMSRADEYSVIASDIIKEAIPSLPNVERVSNDELLENPSIQADYLINCAFARGNNVSELASALQFNERLITKIKEFEIGTIINISSQGIYKSRVPGDLADENAEIEPKEMYAFAKYAQERLFTSNFGEKVTNIRMASLSRNAGFMLFFVDSVIAGKDIVVTAPNQYVSILDVGDAARGIIQVMNIPESRRKQIYNLGNGTQFSILQIAEITKEIGQERGYSSTSIHVEDNGKIFGAGVDPLRLKSDTGWEADISIYKMINDIFDKKEEEK